MGRLRTSVIVAAAVCAITTPSADASRRVTPRAGDWEASGQQMSFAVGHRRVRGKPRTVMELTGVLTTVCTSMQGRSTASASVALPVVRISSSGLVRWVRSTVGGRRDDRATLTGSFPTGARARLTYRSISDIPALFSAPPSRCDTGPIRIVAVPAQRTAVRDGVWHGQAANGEAVSLNVIRGGRLLAPSSHPPSQAPAFQFGTFSSACAGSICQLEGADQCSTQVFQTMFVTAAGAFADAASGTGERVSGSFDGPSDAHGTWDGGSASPCDSSWTARR